MVLLLSPVLRVELDPAGSSWILLDPLLIRCCCYCTPDTLLLLLPLLQGGRTVHLGGVAGFRTGEGVSAGEVPVHKVTIHNHYTNSVVEVDVPEDRCAHGSGV